VALVSEEDAFGVDLQIPDTHISPTKRPNFRNVYYHGHEDHCCCQIYYAALEKYSSLCAQILLLLFLESRLAVLICGLIEML
jgi:mRNA degradation ribonuclease J1/J2